MMGGGINSILTPYLMGNFFLYFELCSNRDLCQRDDERSFETPTISILNDKINITVERKMDDLSILIHNGSIFYTSSDTSRIHTNATHFTLIASCATAAGSYMLQTASHGRRTTCQYFNVTNCLSYSTPPSYPTPTHLAQKSCSECKYRTFTITSFVILIFYFIF
nr:membrane glycoprotein E51 [Elephant endotheliotropic herpesvirus 1A]